MNRPKNSKEYRSNIAETFATILEEDGLSWKKGWKSYDEAPYNGVTKAHYKEINAFWLSILSFIYGYNDPRWVTMVQIMDKNKKYHPSEKWHLKKGSTATYVEYWYQYDLIDKKALTWDQYHKALNDGRDKSEFRLSSRYTAVFNAHDVEGMPELISTKSTIEIHQDELIKRLSENMGVEILNDGGSRAYYSPRQDKIHLPVPSLFYSEYEYNSTALHELGHSTGHPSRLNRPQTALFGTEGYATEELVAEIISAMMGSSLHMEPTQQHIDNHKAYVQSWIKQIRDKPETLVKAIKDAQAAVNYMDLKAGLITEKEYKKSCESVLEIKQPEQKKDCPTL